MNENKNIITIEDEIKEFSDKPVKSSALYKKVKELESNAVPDSSEASVGDVLTKGEDGIGWSAPGGGTSTIGYPTIFLERRQSTAYGATNGELYTALDNYNSNGYEVFIVAGESNKLITIPLSISFVSGHPSTLKGTGMNYSSISGTTLTIKIFEITVTINNNSPDSSPSLTITETTKTITLDS